MFSFNMYCDIVYSCAPIYPKGVYSMFVVNKGAFFSFAQRSEQIRIAKTKTVSKLS